MTFVRPVFVYLLSLSALSVSAENDRVESFLSEHCFECHDDSLSKGDFRIDLLATDGISHGRTEAWARILHRLEAGDMPPPKRDRPAPDELSAVLDWIKQELAAEVAARRGAGGSLTRRLNRLEYENTIHDLLGIDLPLKNLLPEDDYRDGFNTSAEALRISPVHIQRYLEAADLALQAAVMRGPRPEPEVHRLQYSRKHETRFFGQKSKGRMFVLEDGELRFFCEPGIDKPAYLDQFSRITNRRPGRYRIRVAARTIDPQGEEITFDIRTANKKQRLGIETLAWFDAPGDNYSVFEVEARFAAGDTIIIAPYRLNDMRRRRGLSQYAPGDDPIIRNRVNQPKDLPPPKGLALGIGRVEVEGPLTDKWPPAGHQRLFADVPMVEFRKLPGDLKTPGSLEIFRKSRSLTPHSPRPVEDARRLLTEFLPRAFRRPVDEADIEDYLTVAVAHLDAGECFESAMMATYRAVLCSPGFLFLSGTSGPLDDHALASRLAYFLRRSSPDESLLKLADEGKLREPGILATEMERLLASRGAKAFVNDFVDQWLHLREIYATQPDKHLFPEFYVQEGGRNFKEDALLIPSMLGETRLFFSDLLDTDGSVLQFIDSDFTWLNHRLAEFYGLPEVRGSKLERVLLPAGSVRGGVLTQASVLKVTANGTRTSPVVRGVWILENILGRKPLPPPPDAGSIDPDTRGTATIREQLAKHQTSKACASCHRQIDPPGFALEAFDPAGQWRGTYRTLEGVEAVTKRRPQPPAAPGEELRGRDILGLLTWLPAQPVDAGGMLLNGATFDGPSQYKKLLLEEPKIIARNLAAKLLTFATGRHPEAGDILELDRIVAEVEKKDFGLRSLIHEVVQSQLFLAR